MAVELEPAVIYWHNGQIHVASEIVKKIRPLYDGEIGDTLAKMIEQFKELDLKLSKKAVDTNQKLLDEFQGETNERPANS